jgi:hypothetical protein
MADIISLAEYKVAKNITTTDYDTQLTALIPMVNGFIEEYCGRVFGPAEHTEQNEGTIDALSRYFFHVKNRPIISVQDITLKFTGASSNMAVDLTNIDIFADAGYIYYSYDLSPPTAVLREEYRNVFYYTITYSGGVAVPYPVKLAAITMLGDAFEYFNRVNNAVASGTQHVGEISSVSIGDYSESHETGQSLYNMQHNSNTGIMMTQTVKDLLDLYKYQGQSN